MDIENVLVVAEQAKDYDGLDKTEDSEKQLDPVAVKEAEKVPTVAKEAVNEEQQDLTEENSKKNSETDEYAYLEATGFTSELFKIEVRGLPKYYGISELKKLLNVKMKLSTNKIKIMKPGSPFIFICFRCQEDREAAIKALDGFKWKGKTLSAFEAKPAPDPLVRRRKEASAAEGEPLNTKRRSVEACATALAYLSYEEQLLQKQSEMENVLQKFGKELWSSVPSLRSYIEKQREHNNGLPCALEPLRPSPVQNGYRNKCEFSIGKDASGVKRVGFRVGSYSNGFLEVEPIKELKHIPDCMKQTVSLFEEYVQASKLEVYSSETYQGYFRQLTVRMSHATGQVMVVVGVHLQELPLEEQKSLKNSIVKCLTSEVGKNAGICSVYFEVIQKRQQGQFTNPIEHLYGETHIEDTILGLKFRISPQAFFQINTPAAEVLYQCAIDLASPDKNTSILDICCGTGTIGLCFAKHCKQVLGVDIVAQAIEDAKHNAERNEIENCKFFDGNADDLIMSLIRYANIVPAQHESLLAILDPPRAGLHVRSITQLRNARGLNKLVYVSCSPQSAIKNWVDLMRPCSKQLRGEPFIAKRAIAVDLFPHTPHTELVILFEREPENGTVEETIIPTSESTDGI
ncbi:tRNA (uracil-5-)-methyltransferase homolog A [Anopheles ziemanni]|uniref:tRNA (uracil-5-)-methyltransferase homolog A n=1 Tax=Anopheles coustani TaxID=139045 RepID=UPI0026586A5D|nr:tRNA (uracil-5-)-methyltransferase homolog A [Anopheles coustani]XP_058174040.1 tRNA (uracil-5-)-methyltransferase homolog A [Anopheles ziemanni]